MRRALWSLVLAAALGLAASPHAVAQAPKDPGVIKIGAILAMSGKANWYGKVMSQGIQLAVDEINAKGGVDGVKIEAVIEDHKSGVAKEGVAAMTRLINLHGVQAVLTSFSPPTLAIAPIADEKGILLVNGGGVSTALVGASKYLFHNRSLASDLGRAAILRAKELGLKKMAQLAWKTDAGESVIAGVAPHWKEMGGSVAATEFMEVGAGNIDTQIAKIRASGPDFVALWLFSPDPGLAMKRVRELGMKVPVIGIEYTADVKKVGGQFMEGYEFTSDYFAPSAEHPWSQAFAKAYKARYGEEPEFYAANYYEGVYVIAEAIRRARTKGGDYYHGDKFAGEIKANPNFDSVYGGKMVFQANGVALKRVALFLVKGGDQQFQRYIELK
jgi:branched-chain amino acid transport system substrate-binding protein